MPRLLNPAAGFDFVEFLIVFSGVVMGVMALGATIIGYLSSKSTLPERLGTALATLLLLVHGAASSLLGFGVLMIVYFIQRSRNQREIAIETTAGAG